jgi:nucleotide-binding universal stress UspA family protein
MEGEMRFKTILAGVSGGSASNGALELACRFAERFGAHLEAFHARLDPRDLLTYAGDGFGAMSGEFIDRFVEDVDATAKETKASFEAAIARHQILQSLAPSQQSPVKIGASASSRH